MTVPPLEGNSLVIYKAEGGCDTAKVSDRFVLSGSLRTFSTSSYSTMKEKITKITENLCSGYGGKSTIVFQEGKF
jgi:metal-dependent amidase/aminoacylase/carboxypeptidase family protein